MNTNKTFILSLLFLVILSSIPLTYADDPDLTTIPTYFAEKLNIPVFAGGILASAILILIFVLPVAIFVRGNKTGLYICLIETFLLLSFGVAINWLPTWTLLVLSISVGLLFSGQVKKWITGGR